MLRPILLDNPSCLRYDIIMVPTESIFINGFSKMKKLAFLLLVLITVGCTSAPPSRTPWIHGVWLSEKRIFPDRETYLKSHPDGQPLNIFCMVFTPDGNIYRYSSDKGRQRIYGEFRVVGNTLELSARDKKHFLPMGQRIEPDQLSMDFKRGRKLLLRKLVDGTNLESLDLSGSLRIEFEKENERSP
jgi:hypothetical protein